MLIKVPKRRFRAGDYRRPCDRCGWNGWTRSELSKEIDTDLLVCPNCKDEKRLVDIDDNTDFTDGRKIID